MLCLHNVWSFHFKSQPHQVDDGGHRPSFLHWTNMSHYFPPAWGGWQGCHCFSTLWIQIIATFILSSILFPPLISFSKVSIMRKAGDILFAFLFQIFIFQVLTFCTGAFNFPGAHILLRCIWFSRCTQSFLGAYHSLDDQHQLQVESPFSFYRHIYFLSYSFKSTLIAFLDRTGLPWGLEHHWGHSGQCRSLFQRLEQGWDKSGHRPFCITGGGQPTWRPHCQDEVPEDVLRQADSCQWGSHSGGVRFGEAVVVEN